MVRSSEVVPWRAGGVALWFTSSDFSVIAKPIARELGRRHPNTTPVVDGHMTIVGNLLKEVTDPGQLRAGEASILAAAYEYNSLLSTTPLQVRVVDIKSNALKPSQTLVLMAENSPELVDLRRRIATSVGTAEPTIPPHFSLLYNYAPNFPLTDEEINAKLIPDVQKRISLPLVAYLDGVIAVRTSGTPSQWLTMV